MLVFGTLILLTSTAPWSPPPQIEIELSTPDSARVPTQDEASIDGHVAEAPLASDQADISPAPQPDEADRTFTASTVKEPDEERSGMVAPEALSPEDDETLAASGMPLDQDAVVESNSADTADVNHTAVDPEGAIGDETMPAIALAAPSNPAMPVAEDIANEATDQIAEMLVALPPRAIASDKSNAATDEIADVLAALPPAPPAPVASDKSEAATVEVAAVLSSTKPAPAVVAVVAPPPLPKRKPAEGPPAPKVAALPDQEKPSKPEETKPGLAQKDEAQPQSGKGPWQAMALAPADKPSLSFSKAPINKPSGTAYASKVWSALARHKPKAGERGSTSVSFAVGENGALGALRVARSSGNARLDQLALATVRNAAPFPPPPSGAVSYTIRIDFQ